MTPGNRWTDHALDSLDGLLQNMVAEGRLTQRLSLDATPAQIVASNRDRLMELITHSLPLATVMDGSDLVLHAEGHAVHTRHPSLAALNWLSGVAERAVRRLSRQLFDLPMPDAKRLGRNLDLRLTGMAPGSLYLGFCVAEVPAGLFPPGDEPVLTTIRNQLHMLPETAALIGRDAILPGINELQPDPARRDVSLEALLALSPTGKRGINTVDIAAPGIPSSSLSLRERNILKHALANPTLSNRRSGTFVGSLHEIDLDTHRYQLRDVPTVGSLRCVTAPLTKAKAKELLGEWVQVEGDYEVDRTGKPRLMLVRRAVALPSAPQGALLPPS